MSLQRDAARLAAMQRATAGTDHLSEMQRATAGINHLSEMQRATAGINHLSEMQRATAGLEGVGKQLRAALGPSLLANEIASLRLSDQLRAMGLPSNRLEDQAQDLAGPTAFLPEESLRLTASPIGENGAQRSNDDLLSALEIPRFDIPVLPENPIYETNERLAQLSDHISQMRDLSATTAQMQQSLNDVAKTILTEFSKGAEASNKSTKRALLIAVISTALSLIAIIVTVWGVFHQDTQTSKKENDAVAVREVQIGLQQRNTAALNRLSGNLEAKSAKAFTNQNTPTTSATKNKTRSSTQD